MTRNFKRSLYYVLLTVLGLILLVFSGCDTADDVKEISLEKSEKIHITKSSHLAEEPLKLAVAAMISPKKTFGFYKEILHYVSKKMSRPVQLVQRQTYEEVNNLVKEEELDAAFVCTGAYIEGHDKFGMELLVAPVAYGKPAYYSYIIVPHDSDALSLQDLQGKAFAFTDPMSNTGRLAPQYMLALLGENEDTFFSRYIFTYSHDKSIEAVAQKMVDGAAVDSLIWDYMDATDATLTSRTKIIRRSEPFGIPPVVVPKGMDSQEKEQLREIFLHMHEDTEGGRILDALHIDRFVEIPDSAYDSVRMMQKWVNREK